MSVTLFFNHDATKVSPQRYATAESGGQKYDFTDHAETGSELAKEFAETMEVVAEVPSAVMVRNTLREECRINLA